MSTKKTEGSWPCIRPGCMDWRSFPTKGVESSIPSRATLQCPFSLSSALSRSLNKYQIIQSFLSTAFVFIKWHFIVWPRDRRKKPATQTSCRDLHESALAVSLAGIRHRFRTVETMQERGPTGGLAVIRHCVTTVAADLLGCGGWRAVEPGPLGDARHERRGEAS